MYISEESRLSRHPDVKRDFQLEEKRKKLKSRDSRVATIKRHREEFESTILEQREALEINKNESLRRKGLNQWSYDHVFCSNLAL